MSRAAALLVLVAACGRPSADEMGARDAVLANDDATDLGGDAVRTCMPLGTCDWLDGYERHVVAALSGAEPIAPGMTITQRASVSARDAVRAFLLVELSALGLAASRQDYTSGNYVGANVLATLDATTDDGGVVIVGGHFDTVPTSPGAADDGTGVALVLASARYLRELPVRHHRVVFALFDQEELGLIGSREYVKTLTGVAVRGVHIFDMISFDGDGDHVVELWSPSSPLEAAYQMQATPAGMPVSAVMFTGSDHQAFLEAGLPATGVSEEFVGGDHTQTYHQPSDTYANVQFDYLERASRLALSVLDSEVH